MVGIISNSAALFAQRNLGVAAADSESSIAKLSSGNRIIRASDDVAGLAVGTSLATTVSTLKTVLGTTNQASSLLQIADGGLKNIADILARQKSLAVSANSGSLSDTERAFLQQEFAALSTEIDRIVDSTEFNGIKLLDGSVSGNANLTTAEGTTTEYYSLDDKTHYSVNGVGSTGTVDSISIQEGVTTAAVQGRFSFALTITDNTSSDGLFQFNSAAGTTVSVTINSASAATEAGDIVAALNAVNTTTTSAAYGWQFSIEGASTIVAEYIGNSLTAAQVNAATVEITDGGTTTIDINLNGGGNLASGATTAVNTNAGTASGTQAAVDAVYDSTTTVFSSTLQGAITNIEAQFVAGAQTGVGTYTNNTVIFTATIGGVSYVSDAIELAGTTYVQATDTVTLGTTLLDNTVINFRASGSTATTAQHIQMTINGNQTIASQANATTVASTIESEFTTDSVTIYQSREVSSFSTTAIVGTVLDGITADNVFLKVDDFSTTGTWGDISSFNVDRVAGTITVSINGVEYQTDLNAFGGTHVDNTSFNNDADLVFSSTDTTDARTFTLDLDGTSGGAGLDLTTISYGTAAEEANLEAALNAAFGVGSSEALTFQVGSDATDTIGVSISSAATSGLYVDADGTAVSLSIATAGEASSANGGDGTGSILASNVIDRAISSVTSLRADVGALQSRFNFAASNISSAIQNTDAARSSFLDVDVAEESTTFATAQVRLQASISVLAQANQIPQNLLKLIG